jgi:hypothetical protein
VVRKGSSGELTVCGVGPVGSGVMGVEVTMALGESLCLATRGLAFRGGEWRWTGGKCS